MFGFFLDFKLFSLKKIFKIAEYQPDGIVWGLYLWLFWKPLKDLKIMELGCFKGLDFPEKPSFGVGFV